MNKINSFEDLIVWRKSIDLSVEIYAITAKFPREEIFGLTSQISKASNSVSLNISEGSARTTKMYVNQLMIAKGSATEVLSGSILAVKLGYMQDQALLKVREAVGEVKKMLHSLISSIENKN